MKDKINLDHLRHSTAHLLAAAVLELYPKAKLAIGPSIKNGFYYDIDFGKTKISDTDLPKIEKKMHELIHTWKGFKKHLLTARQAKKEYQDNPYKKELIEEFSKGDNKIGFYESIGSKSSAYKKGFYWDLCKGGHVESPADEIKYFKLLSVAGAYWRGDEKNPMLTRIYGTSFPSKKELAIHINQVEEAKKRDHKKIGKTLGLFMFHETSPGMPYWLPKGLILYNELIKFWREEHDKHGYQEIASPLLNKSELYKTSGHWKHYKDDMFVANMGKGEEYGVKPMNCPNAMIVFGSQTRSYKDLPLRLSDTDRLHRYERSGTLTGLLRVRSFQQDDAHNYVTLDQIKDEYNHVFELADKFYSVFGLSYRLRLGTQPGEFMGDKKEWNKAVDILKEILKQSGKQFTIEEGEGAFYGPKADILMDDALGREWQMGTIQLDFQQPKRFKLSYVDNKGQLKTPAVIHRVIYGSLERFIGILIEHFAGNLPVWISPVQVKILPISEKNFSYGESITNKLKNEGVRATLDNRNETLQAKIRDAQIEKIPYMLIVGDREEKTNKVAVRLRNKKDLGAIDIKQFSTLLTKINDTKSLELE